MKIKNLEDLNKAIASLSQGEEVDLKVLASIEVSTDKVVASEIGDALRKASAEFAAEKKEMEGSVAKAAEEKAELETKLQALADADEAKTKELEEIKAGLEAEKQERDFDDRMEAINKDYDLEEDDSKIVAGDIKGLDQEGYDAWLAKFSILAKEKSKAHKAKKAEELKALQDAADKAKASTEETPEEVEAREKEEAEKLIASAKENADAESLSNSQHEAKTSLADQFKDFAFELEK